MKAGIQTRLLLITTVVLSTFLSLAGFVLDRSFRASVLSGAEEQLKLVTFSLMGAMQKDGRRIVFGEPLPEPRLHQPESGLYAAVHEYQSDAGWQSPSAVTTSIVLPEPNWETLGEFVFEDVRTGDVALFASQYTVIWEDESVVSFVVAADQRPFLATISDFRRNLYVGLGAVIVFFVIVQAVAVRWGLRPLRTMAGEVRELEEGRRDRLSEGYPQELEGLAENLGRFIAHEERSRSRVRRAMEDLAHSLKTPLAVMRNELTGRRSNGDDQLVREQLDRMEATVTRQLSRASVSGPVVVGRSVSLPNLVTRLLRALETAYQDRHIQVSRELPENLQLRGDERDLMEMLGNVLENAFKYTRSRVHIRGWADDHSVFLRIEDNGPGIAAELRGEVLNRGTRADQVRPGQGIGLAVVSELVQAYAGSLEIDRSDLGGAAVTIRLPV